MKKVLSVADRFQWWCRIQTDLKDILGARGIRHDGNYISCRQHM